MRAIARPIRWISPTILKLNPWFIVGLFLLVLTTAVLYIDRHNTAHAVACSASVATVTQTSSPIFYVDDPTYNHGYVSYQIATGASGSFTDLWVKVDSFTNTSLLGLATTDDGLYHVGALGTSSSTNVYFLLKAAITASAQSYTLHLYNGKPTAGGTETCTSAQSNSSVATTIQSSNNTVSSVTYTAPYLGSTFTMTVTGDTGTIGAAGIFSYTPASQSTWNADCLELKDTSITMSGGNTGTFTHGLYRSGLSSSTTHYVTTYTFTAKCVTGSSTAVVPLSYISSGAQIKHTSVTNYGTLPPIAPATNSLTMTKTVNPAASISGGTATYYLNMTNSGPSTATIDDFSDVLPSSPATVSYVNSSTTYDDDISDVTAASSISNPSTSGQTLTWARSFSIPSGKTAQLTYQATIPSTTGSYVNSAVAHSGSAQIDQTVDTTDNKPATATYGVGDPSMAASTKTASDINGGTLQPGDSIEYTITARDTGTNDATNVHISDTIDTNTNSLSNVVIGADGTDCGNGYTNNSTSTALDITGATVVHGSTCVVTFRATVKSGTAAGTTILNSASIVPGNAGGISGSPSSTPMVVHKDPILSVTNTENDSDNVVVANQVVTYTTTITNSGQNDATGVDLASTISGPVGSLSARTLTNCGASTTYVDTSALPSISIASLSIAVGTPCVISYTVTVNSGATSGSVTNSADVTAAREGGNDPAAVSASTLLIGVTATPPSLSTSVSENDADGFVNPGQSVTYTVNIQNSGQTDATTSLTSAIPTGMGTPSSITYTNCGSPGSSYSAPTLTISSISIPAANICTITFAVTVNSPLNEGTNLTVGVDVAQASQGGNNPANVNATTLVVDATPILAVTSAENDADNLVSPSQDVTYTITITNSGDGQATGVPLTDVFTGPVGSPGSFSFSNCGSSYTNNSSSSVDITGLAIQVGTPCVVTFHETVNSNASASSTIVDSANVSSATEGGNNPVPASASTLTVVSLPNLSAAVTDNDADNAVTPGQTVQFTLTISNSGGVSGTTSAAVTIPTGVGSPASINFTNCGSASSSYSAPTLTLSSLSVGTSTSCVVTFNLTVSSPNTEGRALVVNADVAQASQGGNDPSSVPSDTLTVDTAPNLSTSTFAVADANGGTLAPGETVNYTLTIKNTGDGSASSVGASSTMNSHVTLTTNTVSFSNCGGSASSTSTTSALATSNLQIAVGTDCVITFSGVLGSPLNEGTAINGSATVTAATEGGSGATPSSNTLTIDATPTLGVTFAENDSDNSVTPSQDITYTATLTNTGNGQATGIALTDSPSGPIGSPGTFGFSGCGSSYTNNSTTSVTITGLTVAVGTPCVVTFHVTANANASGGASITDSADATAASEGGNNPAPVSASTLTVATIPNLGVTLTDNDADNTVTPSQTVQFTLTIGNTGNGTGTTSAAVTIPSAVGSPQNIQFTNCGGSAGNSYSNPTLTLSNLAVATTNSCVITFDEAVNSPGTENATFAVSADVAAATEGGNNPSAVNSSTFTVNATPNLATSTLAIADGNGGMLAPSDPVNYTLTLINTGDGNATGISAASTINSNVDISTGSFSLSHCGSGTTNNSTSGALDITGLQVAVGTNCVITFSGTLHTPLNDGTVISDTATIGAATEGGSGASLTSNSLTVDATPILSTSTLAVSDLNGSTLKPGEKIGYTLTIKNTGNGQATGVSLADTIGASGTLDTSSFIFTNCGSSHTDSSTSSQLTIGDLDIAVGTNCVVYFEVTLHSPLDEDTAINSTVTIGAPSEGGSGASPSSNTLTIDATPQLAVMLSDDDDDNVVSLGQTINMQAKISNSGDGQATGVHFSYSLGAPGQSLTGIMLDSCGNTPGQSATGTSISYTNLVINAGETCTVSFAFTVASNASNGATIAQSVDVGAATEGGNNPAVVNGSTLTVDISNAAPNIPSSVSAPKFTGSPQLSTSGLSGATVTATLSDPNAGDQLRYRIQFADDSSFTSPMIDYRSTFAAAGTRTYTYQETGGTYVTGTSSTVLPDGDYYVRVRAEDNGGASSAWYTLPSPTFTYDTTPPAAPAKPHLVGTAGVGTATIGWDVSTDAHPHPLIPYRLESSSDPGFATFNDLDTDNLSNYFASLPKNAHYYFRLYLRDAAGNLSGASAILDVFIPDDTPVPTTPTPSPSPSPSPSTNSSNTPTTHTSTDLTYVAPTPAPSLQPAPSSSSPSGAAAKPEQTQGTGDTTTVIIVVRDTNGNIIQGAKVTLHSTPRVGYTDKDGMVKFANVEIGDHTATVEYNGKLASTPVTLHKGVEELHVDLTLKEQSSQVSWYWLWWLPLLLLLLLYIYYRWRRHRQKVKEKEHLKVQLPSRRDQDSR